MSDSATPINAQGVVDWNDLGTVNGNTATFDPFLWRPFPILLEGPFDNEVIVECSQRWEPRSQFLSWWLLRLVLSTSQGNRILEPGERIYPSSGERLVSFQIPPAISSIGWNSAQLQIKGRTFNTPKFVPSATTWEVTARQAIVREKLVPLTPSLIKRTEDVLQELIVSQQGELILVEP